MPRVAHLSDLHFGRVDASVVTAMTAEIAGQDPDLVIISGDLTQRARHSQFREAKAFMDGLLRPVLVVPGNHDVPAWNLFSRFLGPHRRFRRLITDDTNPFLSDGRLAVAGITTSRPAVMHWDWAMGRISTRRARSVARLFEAQPAECLRLLVTHHPLIAMDGSVAEAGSDAAESGAAAKGAFNTRAALRELAPARVDLMLSGHWHRSQAACVPLPGARTWNAVAVHAASALSTRLRGEPNAYNIIDADPHGPAVTVTVRAWDGRRFRDHRTRHFSRAGGVWRPIDNFLSSKNSGT